MRREFATRGADVHSSSRRRNADRSRSADRDKKSSLDRTGGRFYRRPFSALLGSSDRHRHWSAGSSVEHGVRRTPLSIPTDSRSRRVSARLKADFAEIDPSAEKPAVTPYPAPRPSREPSLLYRKLRGG